jgi:UDP-N-acetylmuramyl pentapeptide phosphotransferase/UDP-N-acetylglucosamine-1-phosphate transferase
VIVITNSFNLIDGIDGLASGIGITAALTFGIWFFLSGEYEYAILSACLIGAMSAFFRFNICPNGRKIFMGDTGALILGIIISVLTVQFNEANIFYKGSLSVYSVPAVSISILILPLYDTLRVFTLRIINKKSPFSADKNHLHHRLLRLGFSHLQATGFLIGINILFIIIGFTFQHAGIIYLTLINLILAILMTVILELLISRKINKLRHPEIMNQSDKFIELFSSKQYAK